MTGVFVLTPEQLTEVVRESVRSEVGAILREASRSSDVLTSEEAAAYIKQSENTLRQWRTQSRGPAYLKDQRGVRYMKKDLDSWLMSNRTLTSEATHVHLH